MPGIETTYFEPEIAEFIHEPWRHISGLDSYAGINSRMPADQNVGLFWNRGGTGPAIDCGRHCRRFKWPLTCAKHPIRHSRSSMNLRRRESPGDTARIAALSAKQAPTAIIGCPHLTIPGRAYGD